ncbi:MAG: adenosylcobinamide-GDP ribazoletransferase [Anaerolineae bacterium]
MWIAVRFLTRLPAPAVGEVMPRDAAWSMMAFPLVGAVLGLLLVGVDGVSRVLWPALPAAVLVLTAWVLLSGGLHLDGFIDCCDALWSAKAPAERLQILRDVHVGAYGVVGAVLLLLWKWSMLAGLEWPLRWRVLVMAPAVARWAMVYAAWRFPDARPEPGLGAWFKEELRGRHVLIGAVAGGAICFAAGRVFGLALFAAAWLTTIILSRWSTARLGGLTGDVYGMICEVVEAVLLAGALLVQFRWGGLLP